MSDPTARFIPAPASTSVAPAHTHHEHDHAHGAAHEHSHDHHPAHAHSAIEHGHAHELMEHPGTLSSCVAPADPQSGKFLERDLPDYTGRDWTERTFTVGIGG